MSINAVDYLWCMASVCLTKLPVHQQCPVQPSLVETTRGKEMVECWLVDGYELRCVGWEAADRYPSISFQICFFIN